MPQYRLRRIHSQMLNLFTGVSWNCSLVDSTHFPSPFRKDKGSIIRVDWKVIAIAATTDRNIEKTLNLIGVHGTEDVEELVRGSLSPRIFILL